ncbi:hypothetical protein B0T22DRAFT_445872 [Podospora appendiculata]|uniref:Uncharacterized protein n=1 Tax=Podospora appendiculata TaxID=314037 RepID=A0AAE0WYT8_9PEZI|nr:hypothetical protein B0T22DRAFT_445872 [Podospora appendiculata]
MAVVEAEARAQLCGAGDHSCPCRQAISEIGSNLEKTQQTLETVFCLGYKSIALWPFPKEGNSCHDHHDETRRDVYQVLLAVYAKLVSLLQVTASTYLGIGASLSVDDRRCATTSCHSPMEALFSDPSARVLNTLTATPPRMMLGELQLDEEQGQMLVHTLLRDLLKKLGLVLYEIIAVHDWELELSNVYHPDVILERVIDLVAVINAHGCVVVR